MLCSQLRNFSQLRLPNLLVSLYTQFFMSLIIFSISKASNYFLICLVIFHNFLSMFVISPYFL